MVFFIIAVAVLGIIGSICEIWAEGKAGHLLKAPIFVLIVCTIIASACTTYIIGPTISRPVAENDIPSYSAAEESDQDDYNDDPQYDFDDDWYEFTDPIESSKAYEYPPYIADLEPESQEESETELVWITDNGKRYHSSSECSNMKHPYTVTLDDAIELGYTPCSKCY